MKNYIGGNFAGRRNKLDKDYIIRAITDWTPDSVTHNDKPGSSFHSTGQKIMTILTRCHGQCKVLSWA